jgi:hypothetical protein
MFSISGVSYSRFDRMTFNGQNNAAILVEDDWDGSSNYFPTGNEFTDDVFENGGIALRCGNTAGCSETSMLRDQFINNTVAGIFVRNFNALDMWIWYSFFQNNARGVTNITPSQNGAGNFHVLNSIFQGSTTADISYGNAAIFSFRNNYSIGSRRFIDAGGSCSVDPVTIQANTILDTTDPVSIVQNDAGPDVLIDNIVRSTAVATTGPVVQVGNVSSLCGAHGDLFSMGNTFTVTSPEAVASLNINTGGHLHSVQDQVVNRSTINPNPPTLPSTPPNNNRTIYDVAAGASTATVQAAICHASNGAGSTFVSGACTGTPDGLKSVAHIPPGTYSISSTLVVPANSNAQIIGDGNNSLLIWGGTGTGPVLRLLGPSKVTLRDFNVSGNALSADGIEVDNADQPGSRIFMEEMILGSSNTNLFVDGLDYANVELHDFTHTTAPTGMTSVNVTGGPSAAAGLWRGGATNIFAADSEYNDNPYSVSNGAHVSVRGMWNEAGTLLANLTGTGTFTLADSQASIARSGLLTASLNNFQGTAALVTLLTTSNIDIIGNGGTARVLGLGLVGPSATFFSNSSSPAATTQFLNGLTTANQLAEQGCCDPTFLTTTLNQLRTEQATLLAPLANGVTDARFYRVSVGPALTGIHLQAASVASQPSPTASLAANPTSISGGQSSTLSWSSSNATSCTSGNFTVSGISGSAVVKPSVTTPYSITCSGNGGSATASATVTVATPPPAPTASLSANPTSISGGQSSTLSWSSSNATSCTSGNFTVSGISGSAVVKPSVTTTYSITCSGNGGSATASATVTVATPPPAPTASLSANPTSISGGQSSTLSWSSSNTTSCTSGNFTVSGISGSAVAKPSVTTSYSITCSGNGGSATASATVTVATPPPAPTASLSANPTSISTGKSLTLSWRSTNATSCTSGNFTVSGISGSAVVKPAVTTTYSITCSGNGGSATAKATATVARHH